MVELCNRPAAYARLSDGSRGPACERHCGLLDTPAPATFPTEMSVDLFRQRVAAMRAERASKAWDIEIELPREASQADDEEMTQRPTAAEAEQRARDERRRVALAAGGGPRRRVDEF